MEWTCTRNNGLEWANSTPSAPFLKVFDFDLTEEKQMALTFTLADSWDNGKRRLPNSPPVPIPRRSLVTPPLNSREKPFASVLCCLGQNIAGEGIFVGSARRAIIMSALREGPQCSIPSQIIFGRTQSR